MSELKLPSNRSFGLLFVAVFALAGAWLWWRNNSLWPVAAAFSAAFLFLALALPRALHPLNVLWMRFGALLNRVVSPVIMGVIFFGIFTPMAWFMRMRGRDELKLTLERGLASYWIHRSPPGPKADESFPRQF